MARTLCPQFFAAAADALKLRGDEALIDLGTWPGLRAIGFAPYVGRVLGVDPELAMAAEARRAAVAANVASPVIEGRAEELDVGLGPFDLITIGPRCMDGSRGDAGCFRLDFGAWRSHPDLRIDERRGRVSIQGRATYDAVLRSWGGGRDGGHRRVYETWFDGSRFAQIAEIKVVHSQVTTPEALFERALTRSTSSPAVLGSRAEAFRARASRRPWPRSSRFLRP